jgi:glucose-6-phosphate isomerase
MENNGKSVLLSGLPAESGTAAVIWGEPGNNAQHSFFQLLHQGSLRAALIFFCRYVPPVATSRQNSPSPAAWRRPALEWPVRAGGTRRAAAPGCAASAPEALVPQGQPGKPSEHDHTVPKLDPAALGRLIALYEHSVFTQSVVWGINAFDQWGVELGKKLTQQLVPAVEDPAGAHGAAPAILKLLGTVARWRA